MRGRIAERWRDLKRLHRRWESAFHVLSTSTRRHMLEQLRQNPSYDHPNNLIRFGYSVFSQNDEDGIIREIFNRIGITAGRFIEIGAGNGITNNTRALLFDDWSGLWIDADEENCETIRREYSQTITSGQLRIEQAYVTPSNINAVISRNVTQKEVDLLSVDIDGNDYYVYQAISCVTPRVLVIEYNARFHPPLMFCMKFKEDFRWDGTDNFGASLKYLEVHMKSVGYLLVGCNLTGVNAFFVREDLVGDHFQSPFTAETHYEPARYELCGLPVGHPASHATLESRMMLSGWAKIKGLGGT